jgi:methylmalonyl-CoA/ethylmalonyl-CoA epimerase
MNLDCFGSGARFHHVGVAVGSGGIQGVGPGCSSTHDPIQKVNVAFLSLNGLQLELVEPTGDDSPISASLQKGIKLLHVCYEVDDMEAALCESRQHGFHVIRQPAPAAAFDRRLIAFVFSRAFGLVELLEKGMDG